MNDWLRSDAGHRDSILENEGVLIGLGARESSINGNWLDVSGMITTAPQRGFVDLYVKDNADDVGLVPSTGLTYLSPAIQVRDGMDLPCDNPEHGVDNYVYVEVRNAGTKVPESFDVYLYWADPGTNLTFDPVHSERDQWYENGIRTTGTTNNRITINRPAGESPWRVGPFIWRPPAPGSALLGEGHFCLFARVDCGEDPIMHEGDREYENNVAQRNVTVFSCPEGGECRCSVDLGGESHIDVNVDSGGLIPDGGTVYFRIRSRLLDGVNRQGFSEEMETTPGGQITTLECSEPSAAIQGIYLATGETSRAELRARLPATAEDGTVYPVVVSQTIGGRHVGSVTMVVRMVGTPAYIGNRNSGELHYPNCQWVGRMASHNKVPFNDIEVAHRRGYDNCASCLGGSKR